MQNSFGFEAAQVALYKQWAEAAAGGTVQAMDATSSDCNKQWMQANFGRGNDSMCMPPLCSEGRCLRPAVMLNWGWQPAVI